MTASSDATSCPFMLTGTSHLQMATLQMRKKNNSGAVYSSFVTEQLYTNINTCSKKEIIYDSCFASSNLIL